MTEEEALAIEGAAEAVERVGMKVSAAWEVATDGVLSCREAEASK